MGSSGGHSSSDTIWMRRATAVTLGVTDYADPQYIFYKNEILLIKGHRLSLYAEKQNLASHLSLLKEVPPSPTTELYSQWILKPINGVCW